MSSQHDKVRTNRALVNDLNAIYTEQSGLFHHLVAAAGLDPERDFRDRDLRELDLN